MLDAKDLDVLRNILTAVMNEELAKASQAIVAELTKSEQAYKTITETVDAELTQAEQTILAVMDEHFNKSEQAILVTMDGYLSERLKHSENMLLEEMERTRRLLGNKFERLQRNFNELNQYYHITKLENDNTALLLKLIDDLSGRMQLLEAHIAQVS